MISSAPRAGDGDGRDNDPTDEGDGTAAGVCGTGSRRRGDSWHGTHVAGTIGVGNTNNGNGVAGVNWTSRIQALRVLGKCGGTTTDINDAIRWAAGLPVPGVPSNQTPAKVINMSLGASAPCSMSPSTQSAIDDAVAAGVSVVVAAGNEARDAVNSFPAGCNNVITVAASDYNGELARRYSNFGALVEIIAPGCNTRADENRDRNPDGVLSTVNGGYSYFNGTSMAAPHVAGVVGLLLAQDSTLTPVQVLDHLQKNAIPRSSQQCPRACGAGLLNANINLSTTTQKTGLSVTPGSVKFDLGDTTSLAATVSLNSAAASGEAVGFVSSNTGIVTIGPGSAASDATGTAKAFVTGVAPGKAQVLVTTPGQPGISPVTIEIEVRP